MNAVLYTRVSTQEQRDQGYSLRDQKAKLDEFAKRNGFNVLAHFEDSASGTTFNRPKFNEMMEYVRSNKKKVDLILVT